MKEDPTKEEQIKKDEAKDPSLFNWKDLPWARCPICNVVWDTSDVPLTFWFEAWPDVNSYPVPAKLPEKLCPDHAEEIVMEVDGRKKGIKKTLYQDQLNDIKKNGLYCPVCRNRDLRWITGFEDPRPGLEEAVLECKECHALILYGLRFATGEVGEIGEIVRISYREDLQTKELINGALNTIRRFIKSKEARSRLLSE